MKYLLVFDSVPEAVPGDLPEDAEGTIVSFINEAETKVIQKRFPGLSRDDAIRDNFKKYEREFVEYIGKLPLEFEELRHTDFGSSLFWKLSTVYERCPTKSECFLNFLKVKQVKDLLEKEKPDMVYFCSENGELQEVVEELVGKLNIRYLATEEKSSAGFVPRLKSALDLPRWIFRFFFGWVFIIYFFFQV